MKKLIIFLSLITSGFVSAEQIISKEDADNIFSMNKESWEKYARKVEAPEGWKMRLKPMESGTGIMTFNPGSGYGLSIQPIFNGEKQQPDILVVGSYYPAGSLPNDTEQLKKSIKQGAESDLGGSYTVNVVLANMPLFEGVEIHITKK